ncbi:MAG: CCE_0567 family metalloprotein [Aquificaceae bacterium]
MCTSKVVFKSGCVGACEEGADVETQRTLCHTEEEKYRGLNLEQLKDEVKKLKMAAVSAAAKLHDLAEEGLPEKWEDIPKVAEEVYKVHKSYYIAKRVFEERIR